MVFKRMISEKSGMILIVALWILIILALFALGLARGVNLDLLLSRYGIDKLQSYYLAKTAVIVAMGNLDWDTDDPKTGNFDTLYECGISLEENHTSEEIFKDVRQKEGSFTVGYSLPDKKIIYGMEDEERKINLNGVTIQNYKVLISLLKIKNIDEDTAKTIASSVVDWRDRDSNVANPPFGAEDSYYSTLEPSYRCQNSNFGSSEELLLVRGMNYEIFQKIKDFITIFPRDGNSFKINVNTAREAVLQALANTAIQYVPGTGQTDADNLVQKIIDYRKGDDNIIATADDRVVESNKLGLNQVEMTLFVFMNNVFFVNKSDYFRINASGIYKDKRVKSQIVIIIKRGEVTPLFWHEE